MSWIFFRSDPDTQTDFEGKEDIFFSTSLRTLEFWQFSREKYPRFPNRRAV